VERTILKHSFADRYSQLDSPLHLLEARTKIVGFSALVIGILSIRIDGIGQFFGFFFLVSILAGISQIPLQYIVGRALILLPFVLLTALVSPWRNGAGWSWFMMLLARSVLCLIILVLLINTTRFVELSRALRKLACPKILVARLNSLYRYLFVLTGELIRLKQARDGRRVGRSGALTELRLVGAMLRVLAVRSSGRTGRMYHAMLSRGFSGDFPVTSPKKFSWRDPIFIVIVAAIIAATIYL
jgi:cobalt/nickel transport system permease protein